MIEAIKVSDTYKLFIILQFVITISMVHKAFMSVGMFQSSGNILVTLVIVFAFIVYGKVSIIRSSLFISLIVFYIYLLRPGVFTIGVPLLPFIGLFLIPKHYSIEQIRIQYGKNAKFISLANVLVIYISGYIAKNYFGINIVNNMSILCMQLIIVNLIIFREPFFFTVIFSVLLCMFYSPGVTSNTFALSLPMTHQGNRSAIFLLLFLFNKEYLLKILQLLRKKKYFLKISIFFFLSLIGVFLFIDYFLKLPKNADISSDPRFLWFYPMAELLFYSGVTEFFDKGSDMLYELGEGRRNPHNSFFYLLLEEYWVGLIKILIYVFSLFILPVSAWLAIGGRAFFDIFFLLGPLGMIFMVLVRVYLQETVFLFKRWYVKHLR